MGSPSTQVVNGNLDAQLYWDFLLKMDSQKAFGNIGFSRRSESAFYTPLEGIGLEDWTDMTAFFSEKPPGIKPEKNNKAELATELADLVIIAGQAVGNLAKLAKQSELYAIAELPKKAEIADDRNSHDLITTGLEVGMAMDNITELVKIAEMATSDLKESYKKAEFANLLAENAINIYENVRKSNSVASLDDKSELAHKLSDLASVAGLAADKLGETVTITDDRNLKKDEMADNLNKLAKKAFTIAGNLNSFNFSANINT